MTFIFRCSEEQDASKLANLTGSRMHRNGSLVLYEDVSSSVKNKQKRRRDLRQEVYNNLQDRRKSLFSEDRALHDASRDMIFEAREENSKERSLLSSLKATSSHINSSEAMETNLKSAVTQNN